MLFTNWINTNVRFPYDYIFFAVLFAIIYLGYFLLKKEKPWLKALGGIIIVGLILLILIVAMGGWIMQDLS
jgi:heme/copper-type cytochrome/quinol oxidase subunit 4